MVQRSHFRAQRISLIASEIISLFHRYFAVEPVAIPTATPHIPCSGGMPHVIPKPGWMKRYAPKLGKESSLRPQEMNLFCSDNAAHNDELKLQH
jgi:hypothetical protein